MTCANCDELRDTLQGELRRSRERAHELGVVLAVLAEGVPIAVDPGGDCRTMAVRLQSIVTTGSSALNDLATLAGKLTGLGAFEIET